MNRYLGVKCSLNEAHLQDRLKYEPDVLELHLTHEDMDRADSIRDTIRRVKPFVRSVYLHHPPTWQGRYLDIVSEDPALRHFYDDSTRQLLEICRHEGAKLVIHAHYSGSESSNLQDRYTVEEMRRRLGYFQNLGANYLLWENTIEGFFSTKNPNWLSDIVEPLKLRLCMDVSHAFIAYHGDNDALFEIMRATDGYADYYHIVDSKGAVHDGLTVGQGHIDWTRIAKFFMGKEFIYEIDLKDSGYADCGKMMDSWRYLMALVAGWEDDPLTGRRRTPATGSGRMAANDGIADLSGREFH